MTRSISVFFVFVLIGLISGQALAGAGVPYSISPDWISSDHDYATGCGFGDLDNDGWPDLVVANGNDMHRERVIVYYNQGDGTYPISPDWASGDVDYHGHLSIGDVNGDGWLDVAVSVYLGPGGFSDDGYAKLYLNNGSGTLASLPSWQSQDDFFTFSLALGDADGDGDLDLAVATGEAYANPPDKNRIYFNNNGALDPLPGWYSSESDHSMDVAWGDMDGDGALDLVFCNVESPLRIYYSAGGSIQTAAGWSAASPLSPDGNTVSLGDVNGDGDLDIVFSDNSQLGGTGAFIAYMSDGLGGLGANPAWQSEYVGYVSGVVLLDVEQDGDMDVVGGSWWGEVRVYLNNGGNLDTAAGFVSNTVSVVEALPLSDADLLGLKPITGETKSGDGGRKVFYFDERPVMSVESVVVDGAPVGSSGYCFDPESGWLSLAAAPSSTLSLDYTTTCSTDFAVSNWDSDKGNYLFYREAMTVTVTPPQNTNIPRGTNLSVDEAFANFTSFSPNVDVWTIFRLPSGSDHTYWSAQGTFPACRVFEMSRDIYIPLAAPLGTYEFTDIMNSQGNEIDRDGFPFQVTI